MSPEMGFFDVEKKFERSQRRWETVMSHKHENTEAKQKAMKDMLAKKFKLEKAHVEAKKGADYDFTEKIIKKSELVESNKIRKKTLD